MSGGGGSPQIIQPVQKTYGEGMAEALKAQVDLLTGKGDFAEVAPGGLEGLLPMEERVRQKSAQMDTDVLQRTLLGSTTDGEKGTYDDEGRLVVGYEGAELGGPRLHTVDKPRIEVKEITAPRPPLTGQKRQDRLDFYRVSGRPIPDDFDTGTPGTYSVNFMDDSLAQNGQHPMVKQIRVESLEPPDPNKPMTSIDGFNYQPGQAISEHIAIRPRNAKPIYARDEKGEIVTDKSKAGQVIDAPGTRAGDGMIDLLGDKRNVQEFTTRQATQEDVNAGLASEIGESITEATGDRQAGFDADGQFLGLSAFTEDLARGNLSRQREADLADVERLSGRFQNVMDEYKPGATQGIEGASELLKAQKTAMTGGGDAITLPTAGSSTYGGDIGTTPVTMTAATIGKAPQLTANTQFDQELARTPDTLRANLLGDAKTALDSGLTDREQRQVAEAARARSTMMGRTFDQSGAIAEAEARVQEDNNRRMQNRSYAQSVLGQEAGLQQGDITRGMAQEGQQGQFTQARNLAQAQLDQQANAFDAQTAQQTGIINQGQRQQANQFDLGATMDAERLNEQLSQQGLMNYINAVGALASLEDQYTLDPFQALLGRGGGGSLQAGQGVFGQAGYGLNSGPQYINPESGLGFISQQDANQANMYGAQVAANASRDSGLMSGIGAIGGGLAAGLFCWVAREVYGPTNPSWLQFREWMFTESPNWFFKLYAEYGERFANWISNKPRLKSIIRKWMDSKIGDK